MTARRKKLPSAADSPAYGDWRVAVENPHETMHLDTLPLFSAKRMRLRAEYLQSAYAVPDWQPIRGWRRWLRILIASLVLLPLSLVTVMAVLMQLYHAAPSFGQYAFWLSEPVWYTISGALLFAALKISRWSDPVLIWLYVVGHEMTHAITVLGSFGRVHAMKVDLSGGYVETESDNLIIALSPYFVPLWMLVWMGIFWLANTLCPFEGGLAWFYGGFGFWWCFHLFWTCWVIPREQPDMLENGLLFSSLFIIITNIAVLVGVLICFGAISASGFGADFRVCALESYAFARDMVQWAWAALQQVLH